MRFLIPILLLALASLSLAETTHQPVTTKPGISVESLRIMTTPLTVGELEAEAGGWQSILRENADAIADTSLKLERAGTDPLGSDELNGLKTTRDKIGKRFSIVLDAWEAKGGDPAAMRAYLGAVSGADLDPEKPSAIMSTIKRWLTSEDGAATFMTKLLAFIVIVVIAWLVGAFIARLVGKAMAKHGASSTLLDRFVTNITRRIILIVGILIGLSQLGFNVGGLVALIGGGAFIIGFAMQDSLSNFANGIMLMIFQPFDVGDAIDVSGVSGTVESVTLVSTNIRSWDNKVITIPNKSVWGQVITNITGSDTRRVDMVFGIGYDDDADKAQAILEKIVKESDLVLEDPEPVIRMHELADSSVNFICRPWAKTADFWNVHWEITRRAKEEFDANGISIPYPQQDVHMHQTS